MIELEKKSTTNNVWFVLNNNADDDYRNDVQIYINFVTEIINDFIISTNSNTIYNISVQTWNDNTTNTLGQVYINQNSIKLNMRYKDLITNFNYNEENYFKIVLLHEVLHIFNTVIPLSNNSHNYDSTTYDNRIVYIGQNGVNGYKNVLEANGYNANNLKCIPLEDNFAIDTNSQLKETVRNINLDTNIKTINNNSITLDGIIYPSVTNEILIGSLNTYNYLTPITVGILEDNGYSVNYSSRWITTVGKKITIKSTNMQRSEEGEDDNDDDLKSVLFIYDQKYHDHVNTLKLFRENQGWNVQLHLVNYNNNNNITPSTINTQYNTLKITVNNMYAASPFRYILIFGSIEEVPTSMREINEGPAQSIYNANTSTAACDFYYGLYEDNDTIYYRTIVGRLTPGGNILGQQPITDVTKIANIEYQVSKIIRYEGIIDVITTDSTIINNPNYSWLKTIIGIASNEGAGSGIDGLSDNRFMNSELDQYQTDLNATIVELYQGSLLNSNDNPGDPNSNELITSINSGSSLLLYAGHASEVSLATTGFNINSVSGLSNTDKLFLGCVVGCSIGSHDENYMSLSERLQCDNDGSIAMFVSSILQSWVAPMYMQRALNTAILGSTSVKTIGQLYFSAVTTPRFLSSLDIWYYHILGDPCTRYILTLPELRSDPGTQVPDNSQPSDQNAPNENSCTINEDYILNIINNFGSTVGGKLYNTTFLLNCLTGWQGPCP